MQLTITPAAEKFMRRMVRFGNAGQDAGFRLTVTTGGCSGLGSAFDVVAAPAEGDATLDVNGLKLFLERASCALLEGATVDFHDSGMAAGLAILNATAGGCACGSSGGAGAGSGNAKINISALQRGKQ